MSIHHGSVSAVTKLIRYRDARELRPCSPKTGAYCIARDKLDEDAMHRLVTQSGQAIEDKAPDQWLWLGHRMITGDGTTLSMADTPENQAEYPQLRSMKPDGLCDRHFRRFGQITEAITGDTSFDNATPGRCALRKLNAAFAQRISETDLRLDRKSEICYAVFPKNCRTIYPVEFFDPTTPRPPN